MSSSSCAAPSASKEIEDYLRDGDLVFIAVGMGGGTGTGAAPIVAEVSKELGILTVGVVTTPFKFEGKKRMSIAKSGLEDLRKHTDTLITIPNDRLLEIAETDNKNMTVYESFLLADDVLKQAISGLTMLINRSGVINLDFADVKTVMSNKGRAIIGIGHGVGEGRGLTAAKRAIQSPILNDVNIKGATGVIINFVADKNFTLKDAESAASYVENYGTEDAHVMFGLVYDDTKTNEVSVTVIATGFEESIMPITKENRITVKSTWEKNLEDRQPKNNVIPMTAKLNGTEEGAFVFQTATSFSVSSEAQEEELETPSPRSSFGESVMKEENTQPLSRKQEEGGVELELKKIHLTQIEKDPFIPSKLEEQSVNDTDFPAFLRRHRFQKNPDSK